MAIFWKKHYMKECDGETLYQISDEEWSDSGDTCVSHGVFFSISEAMECAERIAKYEGNVRWDLPTMDIHRCWSMEYDDHFGLPILTVYFTSNDTTSRREIRIIPVEFHCK